MAKNIFKNENLRGGTYNQNIKKIVRLDSGVERIFVRKESNFLNKPLIKEIEFLLSLSQEAKLHFPQVERYQINKLPIFYEMPYYGLKTMRRSIIGGDVDSEYCVRLIKGVLHFMFTDIFSRNIGVNSTDFLIKHTFSRVIERHKQLFYKSNLLRKFINAGSIIIEGEKYKNIPEMVRWLINKPNLIRKLTPRKTHMIHGDFHFGNFLVDDKNPDDFILIDPRGEQRGYDYAYDLGKLWHSFHGLYDLINEGLFDVKYKIKSDLVDIKVFKPRESEALKIYRAIYSKRKKFIDLCIYHTREDYAELQILFSEAIHFCALAPFHLKKDGFEKEAICRYITGVKLLNEFIDRLD